MLREQRRERRRERRCGRWRALWRLRKAEGSRARSPEKNTQRADRELRQQRKADFPQTHRALPRASRCARRASARPHVMEPPRAGTRVRGCAGGARERRARSDGQDERRSREEEEKSTQRANALVRLRR